MYRNKKAKRLTLKRETLLSLTELHYVVGGGDTNLCGAGTILITCTTCNTCNTCITCVVLVC